MKLQPLIETLQAIDKGQTCDVNYVCAELESVSKHMRSLPVDYDIEKYRPLVDISNVKLAVRWGCSTPTYYDWLKTVTGRTRLYFLLRGAMENASRAKYPLISPEDLETVCNERGFTIGDLCRVTGVSRNTVKSWSRNEGGSGDKLRNNKKNYIKRAWDLIEGYAVHTGGIK